jgi:hypothetical protein
MAGLLVIGQAPGLHIVSVDMAAAASTNWSTWSNVGSAGPAATSQAVMAYDRATSTDVLFTPSGQTWTWDGTSWTQQFPANSPPARVAAAMAYDSVHRQVVLFGGCNGANCSNTLGDTWTWNGSNWQQQQPTLSPPARNHAALAWDSGSQTVLLFGGGSFAMVHGDTWSWNGTTWSLYNFGNAAVPTAREGAMMAEDDGNGTVVLFGGNADPAGPLSDTWVWKYPTGWIRATPKVSPSARFNGAFAYSIASSMPVLFGGNSGSYASPVPLQDTWVWTGENQWAQVTPGGLPSARWESTMATAPSGVVSMFGGVGGSGALGDTWSWSANAPSGLVTRSGSHLMLSGNPFRFGGPNIYWLGLENTNATAARTTTYPTQFEVDDALQTSVEMGAAVARTWAAMSAGSADSIEPSKGVFNETALEALDLAVAEAGRYGVHLILPLVNNWSLTQDPGSADYGSISTFANWEGDTNSSSFYTDPKVIGDFEQYLHEILTRVNTYTGVPYADDPAIMAWETGNEIGPPTSWTSTISAYIKSLDPNHLVMDGTYGINDGASYQGPPPTGVCGGDLGVSTVDLYSNHFYPMNTTIPTADGDAVASCGKAFVVGEYDWNNVTGGPALADFLSPIAADTNVAGDLYWDMWPHNPSYGWDQCECNYYTLDYPGESASTATKEQQLRTHAYTMSGVAVPMHAAVGASVVTLVTPSRQIEWRGVAGASNYSVQESTTGANGPWTTICDLCATDASTPWQDPNSLEGPPIWYRVQADNLDGSPGPWSASYQFG